MFAQIRKTLVAAAAAVTALGLLAQDGWTTAEAYTGVSIAIGVALVYFTPNAEGGEPPMVGGADDGALE